MTAAQNLAPHKLTADEFLCLPEEDEGFELVDGELELEEVGSGAESGWLAGEAFCRIGRGTDLIDHVLAFSQGTGLAIWDDDPHLVRKPDAMFIAKGRLPAGGIPKGWLKVVPDLVVEVVSPNEIAGRLQRKLFDYRRAGVPLIWVIYPEPRSAVVWRGDEVELVPGSGVLDAGSVFPGFRLDLGALFAALDEAV